MSDWATRREVPALVWAGLWEAPGRSARRRPGYYLARVID